MNRYVKRKLKGLFCLAAASAAVIGTMAAVPRPDPKTIALAAAAAASGRYPADVPPDDIPETSPAADLSFTPVSYGKISRPSSADEESHIENEENADDIPNDPSEDLGHIERRTYGHASGDEYIDLPSGQIRNLTSLPNEDVLAAAEKGADFTLTADGSVQVMIMHTHTTECFEPSPSDTYDSSRPCRTQDLSQNMAAVGDKIAEELEKAGIGVVHDVTLHDYPSYNGSYERSAVTVEDALEKYPDIKIVLDIHRDAIETEDGLRVAPVAEINGKNAAQLMIICGADDGTMDMPDYLKNLGFAADLQQSLENAAEGITRPILFDYRRYNQDLTTGSLLIEVGSHGNSLDEALYSGEIIGKALASLAEK